MSEHHFASGANQPTLEKAVQDELASFANKPINTARISEIISSIAAQRLVEELENPKGPKDNHSDVREFFRQEAIDDHTLFGVKALEELQAAGRLTSTYVTPQRFIEGTNSLLVQYIDEQFPSPDSKERELALAGVKDAQTEMLELMYAVTIELEDSRD